MSVLSTLLYALAAAHLLFGIPALFAPGVVRDVLPPRYADAVGDEREWRGFGAGVTSVGISLAIIAAGLAA